MRRGGAISAGILIVMLVLAGPAMAGTQGPTKSLGKAKGLEYRTATFPQVVSQAGASVDCKPDTFAIGGGGFIDGADGLSSLVTTTPDGVVGDIAGGWLMQGTSTAGRDAVTYAICAKVGLEFTQGFTSFPGTPGTNTASASCPSGRLVSAGIQNDGSNPVRILGSKPIDGPDGGSVADDAWQLVGENTGASMSTPTIWLACSETAVLTYASKTKNVPQGALGKPIAKCPNRYAVTGGGFEANAGGTPSGLSPWDSKDRQKTPDDGWKALVYNASIDTLAITSTAICLRGL